MSDILDDLARYEADPPEPELMLDLGGRLHLGDRVLPWAPASSIVSGTADDVTSVDPAMGHRCTVILGSSGICGRLAPCRRHPKAVRADVAWRETTMEAFERQAEAVR